MSEDEDKTEEDGLEDKESPEGSGEMTPAGARGVDSSTIGSSLEGAQGSEAAAGPSGSPQEAAASIAWEMSPQDAPPEGVSSGAHDPHSAVPSASSIGEGGLAGST